MPATLPVSYTTVSLMQVQVPELSSVTAVTSAHMASYAGDAQAFVDAKISRAYSLPIGDYPELQRITTDLAVYFTLRRVFTQERMNASMWPDRYKEATAQLDEIAAGNRLLVNSAGTVLGGRTDITELWTTTQDYVPTFWEGPWTDMVVDKDKVEDESEKRDIDTFPRRLID